MWNEPNQKRLEKIPRFYETENVPTKEKQIHLHFFIGACDWFAVEYDGKDLFFGFAVLNADLDMAEWGYFSLRELKSVRVGFVEVDCELEEHWKIRPAREVDLIRKAQRWGKDNQTQLNKEV